MVKHYVLDTNILIQTEGKVIYGLDDNIVVIPGIVLEELDNMKTAPGEKGYAVRESIRKIAAYDNNKEKGKLEIARAKDLDNIPPGWSKSKPDNIILSTILSLTHSQSVSNQLNEKPEKVKKAPYILITNDIAMQLKAKELNITVQDYRNDQIEEDEEYTGRDTVENLPDQFLDKLYAEKSVDLNDQNWDNLDVSIPQNKYLVLKSISGKSALARSDSSGNIDLINKDWYSNIFGIGPKNAGQTFAMHALMAPVEDAPLVILKGCAGTGKTLLSLAAGLAQMEKGLYDKIIITRSNTLTDEGHGFLPGTLEDKMMPLLGSFQDGLRFLFKANGEDDEQSRYLVDDMLERGSIEIVSMAYIRGRSIPNAFIIVDEAQNMSALQVKSLLTRLAINSKAILIGDVQQIDAAHLDRRTCGLAHASEKFKNHPEAGCLQVAFSQEESVRSKLAKAAIEILGD